MLEPTMPTIAELLARIQVAAQRQTVACPNCFPFADVVGKIPPIPHCKDCGGTGRIPNPAFVLLLALVQEECQGSGSPDTGYFPCVEGHLVRMTERGIQPFSHPHAPCNGTGHVLRTAHFKNANIGEAEGGLIAALQMRWETDIRQAIRKVNLVEALQEMLLTPGDHRVPALAAVADYFEGPAP